MFAAQGDGSHVGGVEMGVRWVEVDVLGEQVELKYSIGKVDKTRKGEIAWSRDASNAPHRSKWLARFIQ